MSHCPGCGGHFAHAPHRQFKHILGCGWVTNKDDGRKAPSKPVKQKAIILTGLEAAEDARNSGEDEVEAFIDAVLKELDAYNPKQAT